jgi:hypothetical protein
LRRVIIESPFAGETPADVARNVRYVRACLRDCLLKGEAPFASHALYTLPGVLRDDVPEERKLGMEAGWAWARVLDLGTPIRVVVYTDLGISPGMQSGIDGAKSWGRDIEMRQLGGAWLKAETARESTAHTEVNVGELRKRLEGVDDNLEITVRAWDDDNDYCGPIYGAGVEYAHDEHDTPFFAIDCCEPECENCGMIDVPLKGGFCAGCICQRCSKNAAEVGCSMNDLGLCGTCAASTSSG